MSACKMQTTVINDCSPTVNQFRNWHMKHRARNIITVTLLWRLELSLHGDVFILRPSGVETNHVNTQEILFNRLEHIFDAVQFVCTIILSNNHQLPLYICSFIVQTQRFQRPLTHAVE